MSIDSAWDDCKEGFEELVTMPFDKVYEFKHFTLFDGNEMYSITAIKKHQKADAVQLKLPFEEYKK